MMLIGPNLQRVSKLNDYLRWETRPGRSLQAWLVALDNQVPCPGRIRVG